MAKFYSYFEKLTVPIGYLMGIAGFVFLFKGESNLKWIVVLVLAGLTVLVAAGLTVYSSVKEKKFSYSMPDDNIVGNQLKAAISSWYDNEKYGEVVTFGRAIGRALYISACYETRIEIGKIVEKAAVNLGDESLRISILLDDVGWTKFLCGKTGAKDDIKQALELAEKMNNYKAISKAYRHFLAMEISEWKDPSKARYYLQLAYEACGKMPDGREKESVLSGLYFADSELNFKEGNYDKALEMAKLSEEKRKTLKEIDRHMRFYAQIGKIELFRPNGDIREARDHFRKGIEESESVSRIDELVKNAYGYAICCYKLGDKKRAKRIAGGIIKRYGNIPLYTEDAVLRTKYKELTQTN